MENLREVRVAAGLTQAALAERSGIAASNISSYESHRRGASPAMRKRLLDAMALPSQRLREHLATVKAVIARHGAQAPRVFGSVARGEDTIDSDLDLLVRVPPEAAWAFVSLRSELEELLGVPVDVVSEGGLGPQHGHILTEAVPL